jgi:peroxiredoxin
MQKAKCKKIGLAASKRHASSSRGPPDFGVDENVPLLETAGLVGTGFYGPFFHQAHKDGAIAMTDRPRISTPRDMAGVAFTLLLALIPLAISGCPAEAPPTNSITADPDAGKQTSPPSPGRQRVVPSISLEEAIAPKVALRLPELPPTPLHRPRVLLSAGHQQTCLVGVGDPFPEITLRDLEGNPVSLSSQYGEKLTVVVFWNDRKVFARNQFSRLALDTDHFQSYGVSVVAVNVGDAPEIVAQLQSQYPGGYRCLLDPQGKSLARVANAKMPRTYVLDAEGRILWFDIEYSLGTERELENALYWHLLPEGQRFLPTARLSAPAAGTISG